ncbi:MAG: hypothetical protein ACUVRV_10245 [Cyanobacteriota bacterium]
MKVCNDSGLGALKDATDAEHPESPKSASESIEESTEESTETGSLLIGLSQEWRRAGLVLLGLLLVLAY